MVTHKCDSAVLSGEALRDALAGPLATWVLSGDGSAVRKKVVAKTWAHAMAFLNGVSAVAEAAEHHPDVHLTNWREVELVLTTHASGGLTAADAGLASKIDAVDVVLSPAWARAARALDEDRPEAPVAFDATHFAEGLNGDFSATSARSADDVEKKFVGLFEDAETRDIAAARDAIVDVLGAHGLVTGAAVADVGAGTGVLLAGLSRAVGAAGRVIAVEPAPVFLDHVARRLRDGDFPLGNVVVRAEPPPPTAALLDLVLLVDVYHHLEYPRTTLRAYRRALADRGALVVVDFHKDARRITSHDADWVARHIRADQATFRAEIEGCGFSHVAEPHVPGLPENYVMVFHKTPALREPGAGWADAPKRPKTAAAG